MIRSAGVPVFRSSDQAIRSLGRYLCHRAPDDDGVVQPVDAPVSKVVPMGGKSAAAPTREPTKA
jgi:hypothetical protein